MNEELSIALAVLSERFGLDLASLREQWHSWIASAFPFQEFAEAKGLGDPWPGHAKSIHFMNSHKSPCVCPAFQHRKQIVKGRSASSAMRWDGPILPCHPKRPYP
jgi:hypothetical protein